MIEPFSWAREYRSLWHHAPSAFWLSPTADDMAELIEPHLERADAIGDHIRGMLPVLLADDAAASPEVARRIAEVRASVSRSLAKLEG